MLKFLGWVHARLYQGLLWALLVPFRSMGSLGRLVLVWLGEEFRRWMGILASGAMVFLFGKAVMYLAPAEVKRPLAMTVLLLAALWAVAAFRAARYTMTNSLRLVRQRQAFRDLAGDVGTIRNRVADGLAHATWGTPVEGAFRANRKRADTERRAEAAAEVERAAEESRREELADLEPDPYTWENA